MSDEVDLNCAERELEAALRTLRPAAARIDLAAAALEAESRTTAKRFPAWRLAAAAALIAIGAWLAFGRGKLPQDGIAHDEPIGKPNHIVSPVSSVAPSTLLAYRRALAKSPAALEAMLDRETSAARPQRLESVGVRTLWSADLPRSLGDLL
jgi:hypothetical protein